MARLRAGLLSWGRPFSSHPGTPLKPRNPFCIAALWVVLLAAGPVPCLQAAAANARDRLVVGLGAYRDGFYDLAAKELRAYLEAVPDDSRAEGLLDLLARAEIARENWTGAVWALERLVATGGAAAEARYRLGWVLARAGEPGRAREVLDAYLSGPGGEQRADALFLAAQLALDQGDARSAADRAAEFLEAFPADGRRAEAWDLRVRAAADGAPPETAVEVASAALGDPAVRAAPAVREAVALAGATVARRAGDLGAEARFWEDLAGFATDPELRARARYGAGAALLRAGNLAAAREHLEAVVTAAPAATWAGDARLALADLEAREGNPGRALGYVEAVLAGAGPGDRFELEKTAFALAVDAGDHDRAARHAASLLPRQADLEPAVRARVRRVLAETAAAAGRVGEAVAHWDAVPDGAPGWRAARLDTARLLLQRGRPADALRRLAPLLGADDPGGAAHLLALAAADAAGDRPRAARLSGWLAEHPPPGRSAAEFLKRRAVYLEQGPDRAAYEAALRALAALPGGGPDPAWAAAELQRLAFQAGDWKGVLRWSERAREGDPTGGALYREAEALRRSGETERARVLFQRLAGAPGRFQGPARAQLGVLAEEAGDLDGAVAAYRSALDAGLDQAAAAWVGERLETLSAAGPKPAPGARPPEKR